MDITHAHTLNATPNFSDHQRTQIGGMIWNSGKPGCNVDVTALTFTAPWPSRYTGAIRFKRNLRPGECVPIQMAIDLPDDIARHLEEQWGNVPRHVLESLALAWYQSGALHEEQTRRLLGYSTRLRVHAFLKEHGVPLQYALEDLEKDRATHERLGI